MDQAATTDSASLCVSSLTVPSPNNWKIGAAGSRESRRSPRRASLRRARHCERRACPRLTGAPHQPTRIIK